ncbi:MAG: class F sortase [Nitriliruptoraceae bacterium]
MSMSPRLLVIVGLLLSIGTPAIWWATNVGAATVGEVPDPAPAVSTDLAEPSDAANPAEQTAPTDLRPESATFSTTAPQGALDPSAAPARIWADAAGIDAPVVPVGLDAGGDMEVPRDGAVAGWYQRGAVPGEAGTAVITAHVDTRVAGPGAFFRLGTLAPGDVVEVASGTGGVSRWEVTGREQRPKDDLPHEVVYARSGQPRLVLITCAGAFDDATRRYADNVLVYARLIDRP